MLAATLSLAAAARAQQIPQVDDSTSPPTHTAGHWTIEGPHETVNPANGQVSLRFAVALPPGRGLSPGFSVAYDSAGAQNLTWLGDSRVYLVTEYTQLASDGWSYTIPQLTYSTFNAPEPADSGVLCTVTTSYVFQGGDGSRRGLWLAVAGYDGKPYTDDPCEGANGFPPQTTDNEGDGWLAATNAEGDQRYRAEPVTVTTPDGTAYGFSAGGASTFGQAASTITDRNGNKLTISVSGGNAITYTDELGRIALATSGFAQSSDTITTDGYGTYTAGWAAEPGGPAVTLDSGSCPETSAPSMGGGAAITSLSTPEGTYSFSYDPTYGLLDQITYPNGGTVQYTWGLPGQDNEAVQLGYATGDNPPQIYPCLSEYQHPVVLARTVSVGGTVVETQSFQYTTTWTGTGSGVWTSKTTTVISTDKVSGKVSTVTYTYQPGPALTPVYTSTYSVLAPQMPLETSVLTQDGATTLRTVTQDWATGIPSLLADQYTTLDNGQETRMNLAYNANGQLTERDDYNYGAGAPGSLARAVGVAYQTFTSNITDRPASIVTCGSDTPCQSASPSRVTGRAHGLHLDPGTWFTGLG